VNAVIAACEEEAALGIEDSGKTKHSKRGRGRRCKGTYGVVRDGDGSAGGVHEWLL
jgi:hypothetical protein